MAGYATLYLIDAESTTVDLDDTMQALVRAADEEWSETAEEANERSGFSFGTVITAAKFALGAVGCGTAIVAAAPEGWVWPGLPPPVDLP